MMENTIAIILAAGGKEKIKSAYPKTMAKLLSKPMLEWVLSAAERCGVEKICVVSGDNERIVDDYVGERAQIVCQLEQKGTAHAVMQANEFIRQNANCDVLILNGDVPLMDAATIHSALDIHRYENNAATVVTAIVDEPFGYGRILRNADSSFDGIVEERDADRNIKRINEVSSGTFWFKAEALLEALECISPRDDGTYNLVDAVRCILDNGLAADAYLASNAKVALEANTRIAISRINEIARIDVIEALLVSGVSIPCFDGVIIDPTVEIGTDTTILPNTIITGNTKIGRDCVIGPNSYIEDSVIGDNCTLDNTKCRLSTVGSGATIGPFVQIRPNSVISEKVHLGNFVEVKNSTVGDGTKVSHLTYVGDSDVGKNVNFGCGTVTVNYNGQAKFRTTIGDNVFIGCNTNLIAPVSVGDGAYTAAGSTITEDVPPASLGIARARQINKEGWVARFKLRGK
jgi:bifunctional UDP-N-acetylglucosamine pyrophosphorylase/glucosamine-1-phosphate N-acetyltransferase